MTGMWSFCGWGANTICTSTLSATVLCWCWCVSVCVCVYVCVRICVLCLVCVLVVRWTHASCACLAWLGAYNNIWAIAYEPETLASSLRRAHGRQTRTFDDDDDDGDKQEGEAQRTREKLLVHGDGGGVGGADVCVWCYVWLCVSGLW